MFPNISLLFFYGKRFTISYSIASCKLKNTIRGGEFARKKPLPFRVGADILLLLIVLFGQELIFPFQYAANQLRSTLNIKFIIDIFYIILDRVFTNMKFRRNHLTCFSLKQQLSNLIFPF